MMKKFTMLCLANSRKHGGRCLAGLLTNGGGWIRPISANPGGALNEKDYRLPNGAEPRVLDVIEIGCTCPKPAPHQPENWLIDNSQWAPIDQPSPMILASVLQAAIWKDADLLRGLTDRIPYSALEQNPIKASLALVAPREVRLRRNYTLRWTPFLGPQNEVL